MQNRFRAQGKHIDIADSHSCKWANQFPWNEDNGEELDNEDLEAHSTELEGPGEAAEDEEETANVEVKAEPGAKEEPAAVKREAEPDAEEKPAAAKKEAGADAETQEADADKSEETTVRDAD